MEELWQRIAQNLVHRLDGPLHFRLIVQPIMALVFATIDGVKDAKGGKQAYFWALFGSAQYRRELLKDGWKHFGKIFILAIVLDVVYQLKVHHAVYPGEVLLVSLLLAVVPYVLLRGPVNRMARLMGKKDSGKQE